MKTLMNLKQLNFENDQQNINKTKNIILPQIQSQKKIQTEKQNNDFQEKKNTLINNENFQQTNLSITYPKLNQIDSILPSPTVAITPDVSIITIQQKRDNKTKQLIKTKSATALTLKPMLMSCKKKFNSSFKLPIGSEHFLEINKIDCNNFKTNKNNESTECNDFKTQSKYDVIKKNFNKTYFYKFQNILQDIVTIINTKETNNSSNEEKSLYVNKKIQKATQTDNNFSHFARKMDKLFVKTVSELELSAGLFEIIDNALDETFDKQSRLLANQFIASSIQKQVKILFFFFCF